MLYEIANIYLMIESHPESHHSYCDSNINLRTYADGVSKSNINRFGIVHAVSSFLIFLYVVLRTKIESLYNKCYSLPVYLEMTSCLDSKRERSSRKII